MDISWKSNVARDIIELSIPIIEYDAHKEDLQAFFKSRVTSKYDDINVIKTLKKSLDARKSNMKYNLRLEIFTGKDTPDELQEPSYDKLDERHTVHIIGFGPAGIFAALHCLSLGIKPVVIERGKAIKERRRDVAKLNRSGEMNTESNYCYGEGGAGTFSDGKLYTRSLKRGKIQEILELFVLHGADENILSEAHPHIGTNKLPQIIEKLRETILEKGGEVRFESKLTDIAYQNDSVKQVSINGEWENCQHVILATGHSARDIYELLHKKEIAIEAKPFAMGFRIEHPQELINTIQYHNERNASILPPASYSLVTQVRGKGVFSFCMCPGGIIAPAATADGEVVVNGWSPSKRNGGYANSGWVTEIGEEEWKRYEHHGPLAGLEFQKAIEQKAYAMGGGAFKVPAQTLNDLLADRKSTEMKSSSYNPGMTGVNLNKLYPEAVSYRLREGLREMTKKLKGFDHKNAMVTAPESRTSSPVRIPRTKDMNHTELTNLYPCGEGAGFAGGIISAALDGVRTVKAIKVRISSVETDV
ncbi:NAD(P)/FAD-dependent oxidoreductase [Bacteroidia bacterium]|nr:NAD(P)/FAD-dependent oxidoreductase [Bacteroidia bacterium]